jgi:hypothetical protein
MANVRLAEAIVSIAREANNFSYEPLVSNTLPARIGPEQRESQ